MVSICHGHDQSCAILDHSHILFQIIANRLKLVESIVVFFSHTHRVNMISIPVLVQPEDLHASS